MDGGGEYEKERKRVREGPVTASHFLWTFISFRPIITAFLNRPCFYACFTDEEPEAYSRKPLPSLPTLCG